MFYKRMRTLTDVYKCLYTLRNSMTLRDAVLINSMCIEKREP